MGSLPSHHCLQCGYKWIARRVRRPFACPRCQSMRWDEPAEAPANPRLARGPRFTLRIAKLSPSPGD